MPFTVTHASGMTKDEEFQEYYGLLSRLLMQRGINLADVPRVEERGTENQWLYVWPTQGEAEEFAGQLNEQTESKSWIVREVDGVPSLGPLRPLEIQVGRQPSGWTFALAPWTRKAIQMQFPKSCQTNRVFVASESQADFATAQGGLAHLARQMLVVITGLSVEELRIFGNFVVTDPVSGVRQLPKTPIQP